MEKGENKMGKTVETVRENYNLEKNNIANKAVNISKKSKKTLKQLFKYKSKDIRIGYLASKMEKLSKGIKRIKLLQDSLSFL